MQMWSLFSRKQKAFYDSHLPKFNWDSFHRPERGEEKCSKWLPFISPLFLRIEIIAPNIVMSPPPLTLHKKRLHNKYFSAGELQLFIMRTRGTLILTSSVRIWEILQHDCWQFVTQHAVTTWHVTRVPRAGDVVLMRWRPRCFDLINAPQFAAASLTINNTCHHRRPSLTSHRHSTWAWNEGCRRLHKVLQPRRRPQLGSSPGWKCLSALSHLRCYAKQTLTPWPHGK